MLRDIPPRTISVVVFSPRFHDESTEKRGFASMQKAAAGPHLDQVPTVYCEDTALMFMCRCTLRETLDVSGGHDRAVMVGSAQLGAVAFTHLSIG